MKKTVYFTSAVRGIGELETSITEATNKKNIFLDTNKDVIVKIDDEDIRITPAHQGQHATVVIVLKYYSK